MSHGRIGDFAVSGNLWGTMLNLLGGTSSMVGFENRRVWGHAFYLPMAMSFVVFKLVLFIYFISARH